MQWTPPVAVTRSWGPCWLAWPPVIRCCNPRKSAPTSPPMRPPSLVPKCLRYRRRSHRLLQLTYNRTYVRKPEPVFRTHQDVVRACLRSADRGTGSGMAGNPFRSQCLGHRPTGSGKTLAAFLSAIDRLMTVPRTRRAGVRVLYISPLKRSRPMWPRT